MTQKQGKYAAAADALISVTVYKSTANQKAGIKVVQKADGGIYITAIAKGGLLDGTRVDVGDKLLSINGRRMRPGQDTRDFMKLISSANDKVTIVVKKDRGKKKGNNKSPSKSPGKGKKIVERDVFRSKDGSFDFNINPKLEEFEKSLTKFDDDKDQVEILTKKLYPEQGSGLAFKKKEDMLFISGIALDSVFVDTELEFGDRVVGVMDVNFMNYADDKYAKTLLKRAKGEVKVIVEKGWNLLDKKIDLDERHEKAGRESIAIPKKTAKVTIVKNKDVPPPMAPPEEEKEEQEEEEKESPLKFSPEAPSSRKTVEPEQESHSQEKETSKEEETAKGSSWWDIPESKPPGPEDSMEETSPVPAERPPVEEKSSTPDRTSPGPGKSLTPQHPIMRTFTQSPKQSPSPLKNASPANGQPRKFLPPMSKEKKKNYGGGDVNAGDVVTRMLDKLDNERKAIKERHRLRLNQSFDESADGGTSSQEATPEKRIRPNSTPTKHHTSNRTYPAIGKSYSPSNNNGTRSSYSSPTNTGLTRNLRKHQAGYLCISVRKKSERSPGVKLRRKDDIFILDKLPHDETRIPVGVQVLAVNGNDNFSTVVKANELIDSKKQEVELVVSFEGLIAAWAAGANGQ